MNCLKILIVFVSIFYVVLLFDVKADLVCNYDTKSYITTTQSIKWSCYTYDFDDAKCYGIIYYDTNGTFDVIAMYPDRKYVQGIGMIDYFRAKNGLVNIEFGTTDLYEGYNYTFQAICGEINGNRVIGVNRTIQVVNRDLSEVAYRGVWLKQNLGIIIGALLILFIAGTIIFIITR